MVKRSFSTEQKLAVLKEAAEHGVKPTLARHGIYSTTYYSWKRKFDEMGEKGLRHGMTPKHLREIRRLEKENTLLKKLLAEKEMEGRLKDDLLKKKYAWARRNS